MGARLPPATPPQDHHRTQTALRLGRSGRRGMDEPSRIRVDSFTPSPLPPNRRDARLERAFARWGYSMDRAERRARTQRIIERRIRARKAVLDHPYLDSSPEPWRARYLFEAVV